MTTTTATTTTATTTTATTKTETTTTAITTTATTTTAKTKTETTSAAKKLAAYRKICFRIQQTNHSDASGKFEYLKRLNPYPIPSLIPLEVGIDSPMEVCSVGNSTEIMVLSYGRQDAVSLVYFDILSW